MYLQGQTESHWQLLNWVRGLKEGERCSLASWEMMIAGHMVEMAKGRWQLSVKFSYHGDRVSWQISQVHLGANNRSACASCAFSNAGNFSCIAAGLDGSIYIMYVYFHLNVLLYENYFFSREYWIMSRQFFTAGEWCFWLNWLHLIYIEVT